MENPINRSLNKSLSPIKHKGKIIPMPMDRVLYEDIPMKKQYENMMVLVHSIKNKNKD